MLTDLFPLYFPFFYAYTRVLNIKTNKQKTHQVSSVKVNYK